MSLFYLTCLFFSKVSPFIHVVFPYWGERPVVSHQYYDPVMGAGMGVEFLGESTLSLGITVDIGKSLKTVRQGRFSESSFRYGDMSFYLKQELVHRNIVRIYGGVNLGAYVYEETRKIYLPDNARVTVIEAAKQGSLILEILYTKYQRPLGGILEIPFVSDGDTFNLPRVTWMFRVYLD